MQVVIGVGLNLANRQPTTCVDALVEACHRQLGLPGAPTPVRPEARSMTLSGKPRTRSVVGLILHADGRTMCRVIAPGATRHACKLTCCSA